jgi:hypothetical protein
MTGAGLVLFKTCSTRLDAAVIRMEHARPGTLIGMESR